MWWACPTQGGVRIDEPVGLQKPDEPTRLPVVSAKEEASGEGGSLAKDEPKFAKSA
jgi:hypothetical protein